MFQRRFLSLCLSVACGLALGACSPALDWREVRPPGSDAHALFPCKPEQQVRTVPLAGGPARMTLNVCRVHGLAYALAEVDAGEPGRVALVIAAWRDAAASNLGEAPAAGAPIQVKGMTPHPLAQRFRFTGKGPDGTGVGLTVGFFSHGTRVFQAAVMGSRLDDEATETFFESLSLLPPS